LLTAAQNLSTGIFGYFEQRITNAYTESVNGRIKEKNRLGRGYSLSDNNDESFSEITNGGFGSGRKFTKVDNTTISGIALLYIVGTLRLTIFHNIYAKCPFEPSWLRRSTVTHRKLEPQLPGKIQEWIVV
jgi:hypothetical protein